MISLVGIDGLYPSIEMVKYTKNIAIANKESIVCGWALLKKEFLKYNTNFIPVDSEHFSIYSIIKNFNNKLIDRIYLTASGGPFLNLPKSKFNNIKLEEALKHPNWSMGNKITIDSSTLMNKVFEVIEARNIFDTDLKKIKILTHPNSYVHAIVKFKNGLIKFLAHDTDMKIPIHNSIYKDRNIRIKTKNINLNYLNNLNFNPVDNKIFPVVNLLKTYLIIILYMKLF
jgi:1-deoxy-D-xylulose-5-phosphate reductoisomerase